MTASPPKAYEALLDAAQVADLITLTYWTGDKLLLISIDDASAPVRCHASDVPLTFAAGAPDRCVEAHTANARQAWSGLAAEELLSIVARAALATMADEWHRTPACFTPSDAFRELERRDFAEIAGEAGAYLIRRTSPGRAFLALAPASGAVQ